MMTWCKVVWVQNWIGVVLFKENRSRFLRNMASKIKTFWHKGTMVVLLCLFNPLTIDSLDSHSSWYRRLSNIKISNDPVLEYVGGFSKVLKNDFTEDWKFEASVYPFLLVHFISKNISKAPVFAGNMFLVQTFHVQGPLMEGSISYRSTCRFCAHFMGPVTNGDEI